ncbi:Filamin/ABP280 repeat protein [Teladorsagia circumcincta]|uniref:Filamin/ABP280 repeat protein n=1 Tax=Teladorsagia circumcincta TaxID=45464 RepID=A0A2G9ULX7_TELCI|nr:Filamin/ABP280 repeat protein [Teladorsagia circumcincta]
MLTVHFNYSIVTVNCEQEVHVFTPDGDNTRIVIISPSGSIVEATIESTETGFRVWFTPSEIGDYSISVTYRDLPVGAPYLLHSVPDGNKAEAEYVVSRTGPPRADLVTITGPGLGPVVAQRSTHVSIDTTSAGFGDIDLFVDGPTRTPIHCVDNHDGTLTMYYVPPTPGVYFLRVMFDSSHIAGSPFQVLAVPAILASSLTPEHGISESSFTSMSSGSSTPKTTPCA